MPEDDRGKENYTMTSWINLERSAPISRQIATLCAEAKDSTYVRDSDLKAWAELPGELNLKINYVYFIFSSPTDTTDVCPSLSLFSHSSLAHLSDYLFWDMYYKFIFKSSSLHFLQVCPQ